MLTGWGCSEQARWTIGEFISSYCCQHTAGETATARPQAAQRLRWLLASFERHTCRGQTDLSCLSYYEISLIHILWCLTVCGTSYDVCEPLIDTCVKLVGCDGSYLAATLTVTLVLQHTTMHKHHFLLLFLCFCFLVHKTDKHSDLQNGLFWDTEYHFLLSKII